MIDTQAIRNKILDLAMRGQLTEQLPEDGTAEELYLRIQVEKQKLIRVGKIKKEKPLPEITEKDTPFDIPRSWNYVKLQDISSMISKGTTPRGGKVSYSEKGIGFLRAENLMGYDGINTSKLKYVDDQTHCGFLKRSILEAGYILVSIAGTLGKTGLVREEDLPLNTNQAIAFVRVVNRESVELRFIVYALNSTNIQKELLNKKVDMAIPNLSLNNISNIVIPFPPLAEQKRIVEKIDQAFSVLDTIDALQAKYADNLTALKAKLIDAAIQGKLTEQLPEDGTAEELFQQIQAEKEKLANKGELYREKSIKGIGPEDTPYRIPKNWLWVRLGNLTKVITKGSSPKWQGVNYTDSDNGVLFVTSENVGNGRMLFEKKKYVQKQFNEIHPSSILRKGDLLTNIVGASIGRTAVFNENTDSANTNQAVCIIRLIEYDCSDYILLYLCSDNAIRLMLGKVVDTARANLSLTSVSNLLVPLPPLAEQRRIVERLRELSSVMSI